MFEENLNNIEIVDEKESKIESIKNSEEEEKKQTLEEIKKVEPDERNFKKNKKDNGSDQKDKRIFRENIDNLRKSALFNAESDLYRVKFEEYAGIPDCIVNQIFGIEDGKGKITIEEAIIMLMNLIPSAKAGINEAKTIQDAIYISRIKIAGFLYNECSFGFTNIPEHSRVNFSNKVKNDCEKNLVFDVLYDYQLMRLSGYLPLG